jgi:Tol biopolymer transport system component
MLRRRLLFVIIFAMLFVLPACSAAAVQEEMAVFEPVLASDSSEQAPQDEVAAAAAPSATAQATATDDNQRNSGRKQKTATPMPEGPIIAYVRDGNIWINTADGSSWPLTSGGRDSAPLFSPDGQWVLFRRSLPLAETIPWMWELRLVNLSGSQELPVAGPHNLAGTELYHQSPVNPVWSPDSRAIAFETMLSCERCGSSEDLWIYELESGQIAPLLFEEEGGRFYFSPDGTMLAVSSRTEIYTIDRSGNNRQIMLVYEPIQTLEGFHYPLLSWTNDGAAVMAAVPPKDQMLLEISLTPAGIEDRTSLWRLALNGESELVTQIPDVQDGAWSPNCALFAYSEINTARLVVVDGKDGGLIYEGVGLFQGWNPDGRRFTFLPDLPGKTFWLDDLELGSIDGSSWHLVPLKEASGLRPVRWIDDEHFLYLAKLGEGFDGDGFEIRLKQVNGSYRLIYTSNDRWASMDIDVRK